MIRRLPPGLEVAGLRVPAALLWGVAGLSLLAGVLGFSLGQDVATMTETEVLRAYARLYAERTGGAPEDCLAVPGKGAVWLVVRCGMAPGEMVFQVGRDGRPVPGMDGTGT